MVFSLFLFLYDTGACLVFALQDSSSKVYNHDDLYSTGKEILISITKTRLADESH
jgi:hypothetical protein